MTRCKYVGCKRKISLVYQQIGRCRCGNVYCKDHRLDHECTFDYKSYNKKVLTESLQKVMPKKVIKV